MISVLRHEEFEHLGYFSQHLKQAERAFRYIDLGSPLSIHNITGVVVMGGPQSANDTNPALAEEIRFIGSALAQGIPVLGICLGAQLMAKALGARVYKNPLREIGWEPVYFTRAAQGDPVFGGLHSTITSPTTFFHWHGETFDMPGGAEWLAYSNKCRHQAFRYGKNAYGIQFHPEITPEMIVDWSAQPANCGDVKALESAIDPRAFDTSEVSRRVLDGWLSTF
jgi:GMP synthase (glutamine-hydrolysing)